MVLYFERSVLNLLKHNVSIYSIYVSYYISYGSKKELVDFVKKELSKRNWSHAELARRSGISQAHISRVINGNYQPGIELLGSISHALDMLK